jgi:hypothetical protein
MSQTLMPTERDIGAMVTYEPLRSDAKNKFFKLDVGFFNGQGLSGPSDFDSHKDLISRATLKPLSVKNFVISGGLSILYGGWRQGTDYVYQMGMSNGNETFLVDSSSDNLGKIAPRHYYGADIQIILKHGWGQTEWRAEYWRGEQPGTAATSVNPGTQPMGPIYRRNFDGAFFYFLQNIINNRNQVIIKYDWYDPNKKVSNKEIGKPGTNLTPADIKYSTLGIGYTYYFNKQVKALIYYDIVTNELTSLPSYTSDLKDNVLTLRMQLMF